MIAVSFRGAGGNDVVHVAEQTDPELGPDDVLVEARFGALNPADVLQREGRYPAPAGSVQDIPGLEVTGVVVARGARVGTWKLGDRVFGLVGGGGLSSRVLVHERLLARVPEHLGDLEAAAAPEAFITAHDAVVSQGALRPGETLLVQGAGGGVGSAALQIGVGMGARVLGVVRSEAARTLVHALGGEPVGLEDLPAAFEGTRGADVVLELVGAPCFPTSLAVLASNGRVVIVGVGGGTAVEVDLQQLMVKRATLKGTVLRGRSLEEKATAVRAFEREVVPLLARGAARPVVDRVFPAADVTSAFDHLMTPGKAGKVLIDFGG